VKIHNRKPRNELGITRREDQRRVMEGLIDHARPSVKVEKNRRTACNESGAKQSRDRLRGCHGLCLNLRGAPISATATLAEIAEELVRTALADRPHEKSVSLLAISVSHLEKHPKLQLELPLGLDDERRRPGTKRGMARWTADRAVDSIRDRFGWDAVGYGSVVLGLSRSVPDTFRELAEKDL
jgi:hypothetical protein